MPEADHAFEVVGYPETVAAAIRSVQKGGVVTLVGNLTPDVVLPLQAVVSRQITLLGTCRVSGEYPEAHRSDGERRRRCRAAHQRRRAARPKGSPGSTASIARMRG